MSTPRQTSPRRAARLLVPLLLAVPLLAACGAQGTNQGNYIDGGNVIKEMTPGHRSTVGQVEGETLEGKHVDLAGYRGKVVVVNLWWSQCPPCRAEEGDLTAAAHELMPKGVAFLGINSRDPARSEPLAYQHAFKVPYPSIYDPDGHTLLAFHGSVPPTAIPSTIVIDKQGQVAAIVLGAVTSATTVEDLVQDAGGPGPGSSR